MKQTVNCDLILYADDSCLVYQHNDVRNIEQNLNKNFSNICDWFVDHKLSIHFGEGKTKWILFGTKKKLNKTGSLATTVTVQHKYQTISKQYQIISHSNLSWLWFK